MKFFLKDFAAQPKPRLGLPANNNVIASTATIIIIIIIVIIIIIIVIITIIINIIGLYNKV